MTVTIRQAILSDLDASYQVEISCFPESEAASKDSMQKRLSIFPQGYLVAEKDGIVVGHVNSGATHKDDISDEALKSLIGHETDGKNLVIFSVAVLAKYQRQGIAAALLNDYIKRAETMSHQAILLLSKQNLVAYYAKFGFVDCGVSEFTHGGAVWHEMRLKIRA